MTVRSQSVAVATADGNDAVIAAGLQPGMQIVTAGVHVLAPGQKVTVWQEKTSAAHPVATQQPGKPVAAAAQAATLTTR
jgi:multidrug efflux system membrane fusion protein